MRKTKLFPFIYLDLDFYVRVGVRAYEKSVSGKQPLAPVSTRGWGGGVMIWVCVIDEELVDPSRVFARVKWIFDTYCKFPKDAFEQEDHLCAYAWHYSH